MSSSEPFFSTVDEFVAFSGGDHAISKILVANNGIGAVKAIRSIRKWAYATFGDEKKVCTLNSYCGILLIVSC
jgi:acetyl-CoA carboxylase/biotin carboxylase 1